MQAAPVGTGRLEHGNLVARVEAGKKPRLNKQPAQVFPQIEGPHRRFLLRGRLSSWRRLPLRGQPLLHRPTQLVVDSAGNLVGVQSRVVAQPAALDARQRVAQRDVAQLGWHRRTDRAPQRLARSHRIREPRATPFERGVRVGLGLRKTAARQHRLNRRDQARRRSAIHARRGAARRPVDRPREQPGDPSASPGFVELTGRGSAGPTGGVQLDCSTVTAGHRRQTHAPRTTSRRPNRLHRIGRPIRPRSRGAAARPPR